MSDTAFRIWRSPYSNFYEEETRHAADVYTSDFLHDLAAQGFNAIWIRGILRDIVPTRVFPELGRDSAAHLRSLRTVIRRARQAHVGVFLYMQPPMGMLEDAPFWKHHPEVKGAIRNCMHFGIQAAMCVSAPSVRTFLYEAAGTLSKRLPDLAGAILITASEYQSHCYSHYETNPERPSFADRKRKPLDCPRCREREPREIVSNIVTDVRRGFHNAGNGAKIIAWNWSWSLYEPEPQAAVIRGLPRDVMLMAGFERGDRKMILGKRCEIEEYSLSFAGPSRRFQKSLKAGRQRGMRVMAKLQIGVTHELATVPNLPVLGKLYDKAHAMRRLRVRDFMGCWNFGNMLTANTAGFLYFLDVSRLPPRKQALEAFARHYFPGCDARRVARGWGMFAKAMDSYPFCIPFLYGSPINYAVAHPIEPAPLDGKPCGPSWLPADRGDDLEWSRGCFTLDEVIQGLNTVRQKWWQGVDLFEAGVNGCDAPAAQAERNSVRMAGHLFHSGWNLYRAYKLRKRWSASRVPAIEEIARDELTHLPDAAAIAAEDQRMGYHSEPQIYMFTARTIRNKIEQLTRIV